MNKEYKQINNLWKDSEGYRYFGTLKLSSKIKYGGDDFIPLWEWVNQLQQENKQLEKDIKNIIRILEKNCDDLEATEEEFDSLDKWEGLQVVELEQGSDSNVKD